MDMERIECARCGRYLPLGGLKYLVTISLAADFDGVITEDASEKEFHRVLTAAEARGKEELENEVYQAMAYILCKPCRDEFVKKPVGSVRREKEGPRGLIH